MNRWALAIGVIVGITVAFFLRHRRAPSERTEAVVLRDIMVRDDVHVDLYLPTPGKPAPWIVFADEGPRSTSAEALQRRGIAVALVSLAATDAGATRHLDERVADFVRELARRTNAYGLVSRPVLAGNETGASLVARLALDPDLGLDAATLAGVIAMNGEYASVLHHVRADAPPFLVLSAHGDSPQRAQGARLFARALERGGAKSVRSYHVAARDERALADFSGDRNDVADLVTSFVRAEPAPGGAESAWVVADAWGARTPLTTEPFWADERLIVRRPIDDHFRAHLGRLFVDSMRDLEPWPCKTYDSIDLNEYLSAHPELGAGNWIVLTNARGEQLVFSRSEIQMQKPVIVVGIDDERNLFRLLVTYNVYRTYTFKPETEPRRLLARPVGAFLHFPNSSDSAPRVVTFADFALTRSSFRVVDKDPLATVRALPKSLLGTLTGEQGCLQCHSLRDTGARSHHLRAVDGQRSGGDALAFEEYPREVLQRFLFNQDEVAQLFEVAPIRVDEAVATQLLQTLTRDVSAR